MIILDFIGNSVLLDGRTWTGKDASLVALLTEYTRGYLESGADPDPEYTLARLVFEEYGATSLTRIPEPPSVDKGPAKAEVY